jgi:hypothetical protein
MRREDGLRRNLPDRVTERTDGTNGSVDTATGAANGAVATSMYRAMGMTYWLEKLQAEVATFS